MPDYAALVRALKQDRTWEQVADICANGKRYAPMYYWKVARGQIAKPGARARRGIVSAARALSASRITGLDLPTVRAVRKTVHVHDSDFAAGNLERKRIGATWPEMVHLWRLAYDAAPTPCDETPRHTPLS